MVGAVMRLFELVVVMVLIAKRVREFVVMLFWMLIDAFVPVALSSKLRDASLIGEVMFMSPVVWVREREFELSVEVR